MSHESESDRRPFARIALALLLAALLAAVLVNGLGVAAAQSNDTNVSDNAPYYENESSEVNNESWFDGRENATLDNTVNFLTRIGGYVVGPGDTAQGGVGRTGPLILALVALGAVVSVGVGNGLGPVAGGVLGVTAIGGLTAAAVVPAWLYPVLLFVVGGVVSIIAIRSLK